MCSSYLCESVREHIEQSVLKCWFNFYFPSLFRYLFFYPLKHRTFGAFPTHFITNIPYHSQFMRAKCQLNRNNNTHTQNNNNENSSFFFSFTSLYFHSPLQRHSFNSWHNVYLFEKTFVCTCCRFIFLCWVSISHSGHKKIMLCVDTARHQRANAHHL